VRTDIVNAVFLVLFVFLFCVFAKPVGRGERESDMPPGYGSDRPPTAVRGVAVSPPPVAGHAWTDHGTKRRKTGHGCATPVKAPADVDGRRNHWW
jgi:hypothetical protein